MDLCEIKFKLFRYGLLVYIDGELHEEIDAFDLSDEIEPTEEEWNAVKFSVSEDHEEITYIVPRSLVRIRDKDGERCEYFNSKELIIFAPKPVMTKEKLEEEFMREVVEMAHEQT